MSEEGEELAERIFEAEGRTITQPLSSMGQALTRWFVKLVFGVYCQPEDYFLKNTAAIQCTQVLETMQTVRPGRARFGAVVKAAMLFLAKQGFEVTAVDQNELVLEILRGIVEQEDLDLPVSSWHQAPASLTQTYDLIVSTVVLMFLQAGRIPDIIRVYRAYSAWVQSRRLCYGYKGLSSHCALSLLLLGRWACQYYKGWELIRTMKIIPPSPKWWKRKQSNSAAFLRLCWLKRFIR